MKKKFLNNRPALYCWHKCHTKLASAWSKSLSKVVFTYELNRKSCFHSKACFPESSEPESQRIVFNCSPSANAQSLVLALHSGITFFFFFFCTLDWLRRPYEVLEFEHWSIMHKKSDIITLLSLWTLSVDIFLFFKLKNHDLPSIW